MIVDTFDEMLAEAADRPLVMGIALHAYLVGCRTGRGICAAR